MPVVTSVVTVDCPLLTIVDGVVNDRSVVRIVLKKKSPKKSKRVDGNRTRACALNMRRPDHLTNKSL